MVKVTIAPGRDSRTSLSLIVGWATSTASDFGLRQSFAIFRVAAFTLDTVLTFRPCFAGLALKLAVFFFATSSTILWVTSFRSFTAVPELEATQPLCAYLAPLMSKYLIPSVIAPSHKSQDERSSALAVRSIPRSLNWTAFSWLLNLAQVVKTVPFQNVVAKIPPSDLQKIDLTQEADAIRSMQS